MRKVLYILGQLDDMDVDWLARQGRKRQIPAGEVLVREGMPCSSVFILLEGGVEVTIQGLGCVANLASGEMIGELSFVDSAPPSATVTAQTACVVLDVDKTLLAAQLARDDGFARRFYQAIAMFLADRLRGTVRRMGYGAGASLDSADVLTDELDEKLLDAVSLAGDRFDRLVRTLATARAH
ncbi:cyclic nucleotide-binding domain-containing protein [Magnetospirillum sulfuroxidans]|uniref:Cyclic nucleotide-binding domain-containing protein n=1 Tax=Magnetospirillum sulfuroxidans TaxID=611300 RepID=A0ABS5IFN8_9PROT|nr:cyclic nucleotide-binding domain-containing protein [Magnetospirillum sulfuroxidans]MBR9972543.1 cyclic nucleotide-binding domain-containing protein [Magnetospirillum sulfuroxidans]